MVVAVLGFAAQLLVVTRAPLDTTQGVNFHAVLVPDTVYVPTASAPEVVIAPEPETITLAGPVVFANVTAPVPPVVASWAVKAALPLRFTEPVVGADCVIVPPVTVSTNDQVPEPPELSLSVPDTV